VGTLEQERRWEYLRAVGRPSLLREGAPEIDRARSKLRSFHARGMSYTQMAEEMGATQDGVSGFAEGHHGGVRRATLEKIAKLEFRDDQLTAPAPLLGPQRRLQALRADGYSYGYLAAYLGLERTTPQLLRVIKGQRVPGQPVKFIRGFRARGIADMYEKLSVTDPLDAGVSHPAFAEAVNKGRKMGWAPSSCWDLDTIDDPEAFPEWTGRCGTVVGRMIHEREGIPACQRCASAEGELKFSPAKLTALRVKRGLTLTALERQLGLTKGHAHHWEHGRYAPRKHVLYRLLSALDATFEDLMEETWPESSTNPR
jgi:transcriptional regulator with XRE-family HTH domain